MKNQWGCRNQKLCKPISKEEYRIFVFMKVKSKDEASINEIRRKHYRESRFKDNR